MTAIFLVFIAGIFLASYAFILSFLVKKCNFPWENVWFIYTIAGLFIYPWSMALSFIPVGTILNLLSPEILLRAIGFGMLFGLGNTLFGFVVPIIGVSTASAINPSIVLSIGAIAPLLLADPKMFLTQKGGIILACVFTLLCSLTITYLASLRREKEQNLTPTTKPERKSSVSFQLGLIFCIVSGLFAAQQNIGFYLSKDINHIVELQAVPSYAISYLSWALSMTGTTIASLAIAGFMLYKNNTSLAFIAPQKHLDLRAKNGGLGLKTPRYAKTTLYLMASLMGLCQTSAFILYGMGSDILGNLGPSVGFAIFCGTSILTNQIIGFAQGDWNGTSKTTRRMIYTSVLLIIFTIATLAFNSLR
jgi:L-rhamnose-H+ transport protein